MVNPYPREYTFLPLQKHSYLYKHISTHTPHLVNHYPLQYTFLPLQKHSYLYKHISTLTNISLPTLHTWSILTIANIHFSPYKNIATFINIYLPTLHTWSILTLVNIHFSPYKNIATFINICLPLQTYLYPHSSLGQSLPSWIYISPLTKNITTFINMSTLTNISLQTQRSYLITYLSVISDTSFYLFSYRLNSTLLELNDMSPRLFLPC